MTLLQQREVSTLKTDQSTAIKVRLSNSGNEYTLDTADHGTRMLQVLCAAWGSGKTVTVTATDQRRITEVRTP